MSGAAAAAISGRKEDISGRKESSQAVPGDEVCSICLEPPEDPAITTCGHWFCRACIGEVIVGK
eukprot:903429-Prorocentrum_minimum.AAC.1